MCMRELKGVWQADVSIRMSHVACHVRDSLWRDPYSSEQLENYNGGKSNHRSVLFTYR